MFFWLKSAAAAQFSMWAGFAATAGFVTPPKDVSRQFHTTVLLGPPSGHVSAAKVFSNPNFVNKFAPKMGRAPAEEGKGSPPTDAGSKVRQRQLSTTESEDSFIICFEDGEAVENSDSGEEEGSSDDDDDDTRPVVSRKNVRFAADLCQIHPMVQWSFAYQMARKGPWEEYARDRERFKIRVQNCEKSLKDVLAEDHRQKIYSERFQNQQVGN